jgi:multidrug transporter EmrE-like cation transporter
MTYQWYDFIGNIGVFLILLTYFLLQIDKIDNKTVLYGILNSLGAFFILISLYFDFNLSAFIIEMIWLIISILGIIKFYRTPKNI